MTARKDDSQKPKRVFKGETIEELAEAMAGKIPEKDFQNIMSFMSSEMKAQAAVAASAASAASEDTMQLHRTYEDDAGQIRIILFKTANSIRIMPVLTHVKGKLDVSVDVESSESASSDDTDMSNDPEQTFNLATDINVEDGLVPVISIPYKHDNTDNELSIGKLLDYLLHKYADVLEVEELDCFGNVLEGKVIKLR